MSFDGVQKNSAKSSNLSKTAYTSADCMTTTDSCWQSNVKVVPLQNLKPASLWEVTGAENW